MIGVVCLVWLEFPQGICCLLVMLCINLLLLFSDIFIITHLMMLTKLLLQLMSDDVSVDSASWLVCLCAPGMLTVTDFIHILYKYYRSPEVGLVSALILRCFHFVIHIN